MKKQFAVFGLGSFGESIALELQKLGCEVVAVDKDMERVKGIADSVSYAMQADIGDPEFIRSLGTRNLDGAIIGVAENLEAGIMATLLCKEIGIPMVVAKAKNKLQGTILKKVGADTIVYPEIEMGSRVAKSLMATEFTDWIELSNDYSMVEMATPSAWVGKTLRELDLRNKYGMNVAGIRVNNHMNLQFSPDEKLQKEMQMYVIGKDKDLQRFNG